MILKTKNQYKTYVKYFMLENYLLNGLLYKNLNPKIKHFDFKSKFINILSI